MFGSYLYMSGHPDGPDGTSVYTMPNGVSVTTGNNKLTSLAGVTFDCTDCKYVATQLQSVQDSEIMIMCRPTCYLYCGVLTFR
jgi:hypothetical protein